MTTGETAEKRYIFLLSADLIDGADGMDNRETAAVQYTPFPLIMLPQRGHIWINGIFTPSFYIE